MNPKVNTMSFESRCTAWKTHDIVDHLIDTIEGYLDCWEAARKGETREMLTLPEMSEKVNEGAKRLRQVPREEAVARLKRSSDEMMATFEGLTEKDWGEHVRAVLGHRGRRSRRGR